MYALTYLIVLVLSVYSAEAGCPNIISRSEWRAKPSKGNLPSLVESPVPYVVIHHAATPNCNDRTACENRVRQIQTYHQDSNGWTDIGYNFLIGGDGNIYEGRGWGKAGAHAPNYNARSVGICFIGNFISELPRAEALNAAKTLIECGVESEKIKSEYKLIGHRQVKDTTCPGQRLYDEIQTWPKYEPNPKL